MHCKFSCALKTVGLCSKERRKDESVRDVMELTTWLRSVGRRRGGPEGHPRELVRGRLRQGPFQPLVNSNYEFAQLRVVQNANLPVLYDYWKCAVQEVGGMPGFPLSYILRKPLR